MARDNYTVFPEGVSPDDHFDSYFMVLHEGVRAIFFGIDMEYIIWCDESISKGEHFSNFYGGAIAESRHAAEIIDALREKKLELNLFGEVKWVKVTGNYLEKYKNLISLFFEYLRCRKIKIRIMFRQNRFKAIDLSKDQIDNQFYLLYYQFIKHSFGLLWAENHTERTSLRINFDKLPDKEEKSRRFKDYIYRVNSFINSKNIYLKRNNISEVVSHDHDILQCLDIILGAMAFKLNKLDRVVSEATGKKGKKTIAKEKLYSHINSEIQNLYPGYTFNVGISTGKREGERSSWVMPYMHWKFIPKNHLLVHDANECIENKLPRLPT